jgi:hypothetical protein
MTKTFRLMSLVLATVMASGSGPHACSVNMSGPMPICTLPAMSMGERVVVVSGDSRVPSNLIAPPTDPEQRELTAKYVEIDIAPGSGRVHVVLSHYDPTVFRFTGAVEHIARVTALGAARNGQLHFGVIGVPRERVAVVPITGTDPKRHTTCSAPPKSCIAEQFFELTPKTESATSNQDELFRSYERTIPDSVIWISSADGLPIRLNSALQPIKRSAQQSTSETDFTEWAKRRETMSELEKYREDTPAMVRLDTSDVYTPLPNGFRRADDLPAWEGMSALEANGALVLPGTHGFEDVYGPWTDRLSALFRNPLDPGFKLTPKIDFVINKAVRIPRDLRSSGYSEGLLTFLVAPGVPTPEAQDGGAWCLLFADERKAGRNERACEFNRYSRIDAATDAAFASASEHNTLKGYAKGLHSTACRMFSIPDDAKVVAVSTYAGVSEQESNKLHVAGCSSISCRGGRVTVDVRTRGKVFLVLDSRSPVNWTLSAAPGTEIVGAVSFAPYQTRAAMHHITKSPVNHGACNVATSVRGMHFGGPGALLLSEAMTLVAGRPLDRFVKTSVQSLMGGKHIPSGQGFYRLTPESMSGIDAYSRIVVD